MVGVRKPMDDVLNGRRCAWKRRTVKVEQRRVRTRKEGEDVVAVKDAMPI